MSTPLRVMLVRPPGRFMSTRFPDGPMVGPPRALLHLAAAVRGDERVELRLVDALAHPDIASVEGATPPFLFGLEPDEVARRASAWPAQVVGISTMAAYYRRETLDIARAVRAALPDAFIVLGGADPTVDAERYLAEAPVDAVCIGEGEATFAELLGRLADGLAWRDVAGLAWCDTEGVHRSPPRVALVDLDDTVPDYGLVDLDRYADLAARGWRSRPTFLRPGVERSVDLVTTRGCPYKCAFCVIHTTMGRRFRTRSVASVVDQLRHLVTVHGVQHVHFEDDVINLDRRRFRELLRAIIAADLPLTWDTPNGLRADLLDAEMVQLCLEAGCVYVIFGVESGNQRVLDEVVDKDMKLEAVVAAAAACEEAGLDAMAFYIVGMPGETRAEAEQTVEFGFDLLRRFGTTPLLQIWRPYVQTALFDRTSMVSALGEDGRADLHAQTGIPYSQFHHQAANHPELPVHVLSAMYEHYGQRLAREQLARWRRAGVRVPIRTDDGSEGVERFLLFQAPFLHAHRRWSARLGV